MRDRDRRGVLGNNSNVHLYGMLSASDVYSATSADNSGVESNMQLSRHQFPTMTH